MEAANGHLPSEPLLATVRRFFEDAEWEYQQDAELPLLALNAVGDNGSWYCYVFVQEELGRIAFFSRCRQPTPETARAAMAEFLTRANFGMAIGNFEMDYGDGEVRFKTSIDVSQDRLSAGLLAPLVWINVATMDRYLPGILDVLAGGSVEAALARVDADQ